MRRASRLDSNHRRVFDAAKRGSVGDVIETPQLGEGKPDGFAWDDRIQAYHAVEVKREGRPGRQGNRAGTLTDEQKRLHSTKRIHVVRTEAEMRALVGVQS